MSLMAANEESDPSAILNGFWVTLIVFLLDCFEKIILPSSTFAKNRPVPKSVR